MSTVINRCISFLNLWKRILARLLLAAAFVSPGFHALQGFSELCNPALRQEACIASIHEETAGIDLESVFLPDLRTLPPHDLQLVVQSGKKVIRFSNSVWNSGPGVLELRGKLDAEEDTLQVTQHLYGRGQTQVLQDVGTFSYHAEHTHWHWEGFSSYEIWSTGPEGDLDRIVARSDKVSYCMMDTGRTGDTAWLREQQQAGIEVPERRVYYQCLWKRQGISVGWVDTYAAHIPGQSIDITHLPNGLYALRSTVNPQGIIIESDASNNTALTYFVLRDRYLNPVDEEQVRYRPSFTRRFDAQQD
ncbi:MAG: hypothetical protein GX495_07515 [Chloroflexi bacterium]|nr:hypothetical protein [Chloroflexota bacterium]